MFELVKITDHYVFDKLSKNIYKVDTNNGKDVNGYELCCKLEKHDGNYVAVDRVTDVAIGIIERAIHLCNNMEIA